MRTAETKRELANGRWIRPNGNGSGSDAPEHTVPKRPNGHVPDLLVQDARRRIARLSALERRIEDRIRSRLEGAESDIRQQRESAREELEVSRRELDSRIQRERDTARREGHAEGFRDGFEKGLRDGRYAGCEEGRLRGLAEGRCEGRREEVERLRREARDAIHALGLAVDRLRQARIGLLEEAQQVVVDLASDIARKVVKKEVEVSSDVVLQQIRTALGMLFDRARITIHLHPLDVRVVEETLAQAPEWTDRLQDIDLRPSPGVERGGCRVSSGDSEIDLRLGHQLDLIREALLKAARDHTLVTDESIAGKKGVSPS